MKKESFYLLVVSMLILSSCSKKWSQTNQREFVKSCTTMSIQSEIPEEKVSDYCYCLLEKTMLKYDEDRWLEEITPTFVSESDKSCLIELELFDESDSTSFIEISGGY